MAEELVLAAGKTYRGKRARIVDYDEHGPIYDDRTIIYIDRLGVQLQYDSPAVANGRHYPRVEVDRFLRWAKRELTPAEYAIGKEPVGASDA